MADPGWRSSILDGSGTRRVARERRRTSCPQLAATIRGRAHGGKSDPTPNPLVQPPAHDRAWADQANRQPQRLRECVLLGLEGINDPVCTVDHRGPRIHDIGIGMPSGNLDQSRHRPREERVIRAQIPEQLTACLLESAVDRGRLPGVLLAMPSKALRIGALGNPLEHRWGLISRAIVDRDDLEGPVVLT